MIQGPGFAAPSPPPRVGSPALHPKCNNWIMQSAGTSIPQYSHYPSHRSHSTPPPHHSTEASCSGGLNVSVRIHIMCISYVSKTASGITYTYNMLNTHLNTSNTHNKIKLI